MSRRSLRRVDAFGVLAVLVCVSSGCEPKLVVGKRIVAQSTCQPPEVDGGGPSYEHLVVEVGWSTGFEDDICDYVRAGGFCYNNPEPGDAGAETAEAFREIVDEPAHGGRSAAKFSVITDPAGNPSTIPPPQKQTRCALQGTFPRDAVYGAWFYVPALAENSGNWNLMYFQGLGEPEPGLWDVSLRNTDDGSLQLYIYSHENQPLPPPNPDVTVPIGSWFHVRFRLLLATDATGAVALYQGDDLVQEASGIVTDRYEFHQWYVGNLADALTPQASTLYVDDVSITAP